MCGIAGILHPEKLSPQLESELVRMQQSILHRGPDDMGIWHSSSHRAGFAHARLAILDLSHAGKQPMSLPDAGLTITFNGEIYNFIELRASLQAEGVAFHTGTDTEVLLRLYQRHGEGMVKLLRGMFAFAIWDEASQSAFLARDPFGIKPLYYHERDGMLAFASEMRALVRSGLVPREVDPAAMMRYFKTGSVAEPSTLLRNVFCLEAGHALKWTPSSTRKDRFWQIGFASQSMDKKEAVTICRDGLEDSIKAHFVSDVPVGIFLSGGVDSTALLALANRLGHKKISTFSIGVDDSGLDESSVAKRTAAHFGADHHEMLLTGETAAQGFNDYLNSMDQPSIDGLNTFTVSAFARREGMKVVLSGLGGDEVFGGYPSFQKVPQIAHLGSWVHAVPMLAPLASTLLQSGVMPPRLRRIGAFLRSTPSIPEAYRTFRGIFAENEACALVRTLTGRDDFQKPPPYEAIEIGNALDAVSACEISFYMRNQLLKDSDVMSMRHGLELRVPFVDRVLFEKVAAIPAALRLRAGKQMLLDAVPEIPLWVSQQPKRGFSFPFDKWLSNRWGDDFKEAAAILPASRPTWYQLWSVFMLQNWLKQL